MNHDTLVLPAYDTKHVKVLNYDLTLPTVPKRKVQLQLLQNDTAGSTTGTTLWLGGQVLAAYLISIIKPAEDFRHKIIDLGSGIGYTSLVLAAAGHDVLATDLPVVLDSVLAHNIADYTRHSSGVTNSGTIHCCALDWTDEASDWSDTVNTNGPYDIISSSDSIYHPELVMPLLKTMFALSTSNSNSKTPDIYIAYEHRDDAQYTSFTSKAQIMGFKVKKIPKNKIAKSVAALYGWKSELWEGISVLHLKLSLGSLPVQTEKHQ